MNCAGFIALGKIVSLAFDFWQRNFMQMLFSIFIIFMSVFIVYILMNNNP